MKPEKTFHYRGPMTALAAAVLTSTMALATPEMQLESADEVAEFIRVDMQSDSHMKGTSVNVAVEDGIAILTGETLSLAQAERAAARSIASKGIRSVVNQITVKSSEDSDLAGKVKSTLKAQQIIGADDIKVSLSGSRVTLTGTVGVWDEKDLAREIVSEVPGIQAITNNLSVTDEGIRTDAQIEHQLQFIFQDDPLYNGLDLAVTVKDGTVSLSGEVGSQRELDRLIRRSYVTGIVDVNIMSLGVDGSLVMEGLDDKNPPAAESVNALKDALAKDSRVTEEGIDVSLKDGIVTLKGEVGSVAEKDAVESTSRVIPGVLRVSNQLKVSKDFAAAARQTATIPVASSPPVLKPGP